MTGHKSANLYGLRSQTTKSHGRRSWMRSTRSHSGAKTTAIPKKNHDKPAKTSMSNMLNLLKLEKQAGR